MTSFALVLTAVYTLLSEPNGSWEYVQVFGWFENKAHCEQYAKDEAKTAEEFNEPYRSRSPNEPRKMILTKMKYVCLTEAEIAKMMEKK